MKKMPYLIQYSFYKKDFYIKLIAMNSIIQISNKNLNSINRILNYEEKKT